MTVDQLLTLFMWGCFAYAGYCALRLLLLTPHAGYLAGWLRRDRTWIGTEGAVYTGDAPRWALWLARRIEAAR